MEHKILADDKRFYINDEQGKLIAEILRAERRQADHYRSHPGG